MSVKISTANQDERCASVTFMSVAQGLNGRRLIRRMLVALIAVAVASMSALTLAPAQAANSAGVDISVRVLKPGTSPRPIVEEPVVIPPGVPIADVTIQIQLSGLQPYSYIEIYAHSEPVLLASGYADGNGEFSASVELPPNLPPGDHSISVQNTLSDGTTVETTLAAFSVSSNGTTGEPTTPFVDGALTLNVQDNAAAIFGSPSLVDNVSTTTGTLGQFWVDDQRIVSMPGWNLTGNVSSFVLATNPAVTMPNTQLGVAPVLVEGATSSFGVQLGNATVPGTASYPMQFASSLAGSGTGATTFNADLVLKSPQNLPVGTYNATFTLTLASR